MALASAKLGSAKPGAPAELHNRIIKRICLSRAAGRTLSEVNIKPESVPGLALWCSQAVWPSISYADAIKAVNEGRLSLLGVQIKVNERA